MLIRCGMQVMNMVVRPCQGCQSHLFTYKAYLMPSNQTTNQLTSDKRKCFFFLFPALPLCLLFSFSPFFCFSHNATNMRTEKERRTKRAKVKVFCKVFAYRRLLLSSSVRWVTQVESSRRRRCCFRSWQSGGTNPCSSIWHPLHNSAEIESRTA